MTAAVFVTCPMGHRMEIDRWRRQPMTTAPSRFGDCTSTTRQCLRCQWGATHTEYHDKPQPERREVR